MARPKQQFRGRRIFDDPARIHHENPIGEARNHAQIVTDEREGHAGFAARGTQQLHDLCLQGHIERGGRLVRDQKVRLAQQTHRQHDPLTHSARQFIRVLLQPALWIRDSHVLKHALCGAARLFPRLPCVRNQDLGQLRANPQVRRQRSHRILKNHGEL